MKFAHSKKQKSSSILFKISLVVIVLCSAIIIFSLSSLFYGLEAYQESKELNTIKEITSFFTDALKNFMFERGRMNVILSDEAPITEKNRSFIYERRLASDQNFRAGFSMMEKKYPEYFELLQKEYERIDEIRSKVDAESQKSLQQRESSSRVIWYTSCTDYIHLVTSILKRISGDQLHNNLITYYNDLIIDTIHFRSIVGSESSVITSSISGGGVISDKEYAELLYMRGVSKEIWSDMKSKVEMIGSKSLTEALKTVESRYYTQFRPNQDKFLELMLKGQLYEGADREIANLSVSALDSVLLLAEEALQGISAENQKNMKSGYEILIKSILQLLASILAIILLPSYLKEQVKKPLDKIVELIADLSAGKTDIIIPFLDRNDEVGKLAGGVELLKKSIDKEQALNKDLQEAVVKLKDMAIKDPLTGLYNRRYVLERIKELEARYRRNKSLFSFIICDMDHFKSINDNYGHDCGDYALRSIAIIISGCCRDEDIVARWGGEEFLILLPDTSLDGARILAERIRREVESKTMQYRDISLNTTISLGVSEYSELNGIEGTIRNADMALLKSKEQGRNSVVVF